MQPAPLSKHGEPVAVWPFPRLMGALSATRRVSNTTARTINAKRTCRRSATAGWSTSHRLAWCARAVPASRPLYRLPELLAARQALVIITEGETKADVVPALLLGHVGTTSSARASKFSEWDADRRPACRYLAQPRRTGLRLRPKKRRCSFGRVVLAAAPEMDLTDSLPRDPRPRCSNRQRCGPHRRRNSRAVKVTQPK
jgi:hypothetical protein